MRIVHLMQSAPQIYGAERCILLEPRALMGRGHDVTVVVVSETRQGDKRSVLPDALRSQGVPCVCVPSSGQLSPQLLLRLGRALHRLGPEVVHSHGMKTDVLGLLVTRPLRIPFLVELHGWLRPPDDRLVRFYEALDRKVLRVCEGVITLSTEYEREVRSLGVRADRLHRLPSGIEVDALRSQVGRRDLRRELCLSEKTRVIGIVARLSPEKGHRDFLWLLKEARGDEDVVGLIVGDGPLRDELMQEARDLGLEGKVHFAGYVSEVADAYRAMDILISCSVYEGLPLTLIEAMALSVPVLAMRTGGCADIVVDGETGHLVPRGDRQALLSRLLSMLRAPAALAAMGERGHERARACYDVSAWARGAERVYEQVRRQRPCFFSR